MKLERLVAILTVFAVLTYGMAVPAPARADNEVWLIVAGAVAAYVGVIIVGTTLMRRDTPSSWGFMPMDSPTDDEELRRRVEFAPRCTQASPNLTLVCW